MRFSCNKCSARYTIADEKVRGKIVAVKCSKCGNKITVNGKSLAAPVQEEVVEERTRVASLSDMRALTANLDGPSTSREVPPPPAASPEVVSGLPDGWHAIIDRQQVGPLSGADVVAHIGSGKINARTYLWRDGQGDWKRGADLPIIAASLTPVAPPKPAAPPVPPAPKQTVPAPRPRTGPVPAAVPKNGAHAAAKAAAPKAAEPKPAESAFDDDEDRPTLARSDLNAADFEALSRAASDNQEVPDNQTILAPPDEPAAPAAAGAGGLLGEDDFAPAASTGPGKPEAAAAPLGAAGALADKDLNSLLFDDAQDILPTQVGKPLTDLAGAVAQDIEGQADAPKQGDPFKQIPDSPNISKPGEIGEQTRFFMKKAGVNRRNPPWKIALFIILLFALPISVLYLLSLMNVGFLQVSTGVDESTGAQVTAGLFTTEGFGSLRDRLLRKKVPPPPPKPAPPKPDVRPQPPKTGTGDKDGRHDDGPIIAKANIDMGSSMTDAQRAQMKDALNTIDKTGPKVDQSLLSAKLTVDGKAGLEVSQINEVYAKNAKAFQGCVETELRRNPAFKGGKVNITFTIASSGIVTRTSLDRGDIDRADVGACLKEKAKRMVFPSFEGDPFDVELPLILAKGN